MELEQIKKLIERLWKGHPARIEKIEEAERYYANEPDILRERNPLLDKTKSEDAKKLLRNADNRVPQPWHALLVDQKAGYVFGEPPTFDVDDDELNKTIRLYLGNSYKKVAKNLCVTAANAGVAWLHVWRDKENGFFKYGIVDTKQIIPIYAKNLEGKLIGLLRVYEDYGDDGELYLFYEYWNDTSCAMYRKKKADPIDALVEYGTFETMDVATGSPTGEFQHTFDHEWGAIPFIPFRNNMLAQSDLKRTKRLIDVYDKVYSGFINDVDDVQEIIFVLTNFGGQDKQEFLDDMRKYKMIKIDAEEDGDPSGVDTLAIDIPIEARKTILDLTREAIFVHGQGVDPQRSIGQNNSGAALKHMYSLLELKAQMIETEFDEGFAELIRFILKYEKKDPDVTIKPNWTRSGISNELEQAQVVSLLSRDTSKENIAKANPLVDDVETELENLKKDELNTSRMEDDYNDE